MGNSNGSGRSRMDNLHYATAANPSHAVRVAVWQDGNRTWHYDMSIDGDRIDSGALSNKDIEAAVRD